MSTSKQIAANQKNALLSTGPSSETGKATSSKNALKTGLTGQTVLLPTDDADAYEALIASFRDRYTPAGEEETALVQSLADAEWRLRRIPSLNTSIYALGHLEFAELFPGEDPAQRRSLIEGKIFLTYQRQLNNLSIQENRLRRQRDQDAAALKELQAVRQKRERAERKRRLDQAANLYREAVHSDTNGDWDPVELGFEFSMEEIEVRALEIEPLLFEEWRLEQEQLKKSA
jgi:hypothetical protein